MSLTFLTYAAIRNNKSAHKPNNILKQQFDFIVNKLGTIDGAMDKTKRIRELTAELRERIAFAISNFKSYEVPGLCVRLGLAAGEESEAFRSKFSYAKRRLAQVPFSELSKIGRELLTEVEDFKLAEALHKSEEIDSDGISELTRRRLLAVFDSAPLSSEMELMPFLGRIWRLSEIKSPNGRENLEEDIWQHCIRNDDWSNRELLEALGLLTCSRAHFFNFLSQIVEPVVQNPRRQEELVKSINGHLKHEGFGLVEIGRVAGSPRFVVQKLTKGAPSDESISRELAAFNEESVHEKWTAALARRDVDPSGAVTLARTLLEDVCMWILTEEGSGYKEGDSLPTLYTQLSTKLNLAPNMHTEKAFKSLLGNCQSVVETLGSLRNKLSDAHASGPKKSKPLPRHAALAVNLSGAMATFLVSTWVARRDDAASAGNTNHQVD